MLAKIFVAGFLIICPVALAQETTRPAPPNPMLEAYSHAVNLARQNFQNRVNHVAKVRDEKLAEANKAAKSLSDRIRDAYSSQIKVMGSNYSRAVRDAVAQALAGYDRRITQAMHEGKLDLAKQIKDEKEHFAASALVAEQQADKETEQLSKSDAKAPPIVTPVIHGPVIATQIVTVTDDFIVDVYHNGEKVPDTDRSLINEMNGATAERIHIQIHSGDWIVFNVANDRLRWDGACGFIAAGLKDNGSVVFVTNTKSRQWSYCDDVDKVSKFISEPGFMRDHDVITPSHPWNNASVLKGAVPNSGAVTIWGGSRNTWIKFVAGPSH